MNRVGDIQQVGPTAAPRENVHTTRKTNYFVIDWILAIAIMGSAVGSIVSLTNDSKGYGGAWIAVTIVLVFALIYIRKMRPERTLAEQIHVLEARKGELEQAAERMEGELKEIGDTKNALTEQVATFSSKEQQLQEKVDALAQMQTKLDESTAKLKGVQALFEQYKQKTAAFVKRLEEVKAGKAEEGQELRQIQGDIGDDVEEYGGLIQELEGDRDKMDHTLSRFSAAIDGVGAEFSHMTSQLSQLREEIEKIQTSASDFRAGADHIEKMTKQLEELTKQFK